MALPPKGDPRRPLHLAPRSMSVLGIVWLAIGLLALLNGIATSAPASIVKNFYSEILLIYFVPGAAYLICAIFIRRARTWAVIVSLVLACLQWALNGFLVVQGIARVPWWVSSVRLAVMAAFAQLIWHLSKSFDAVQLMKMQQSRSAEPFINIPNPETNPLQPDGGSHGPASQG